MHTGSTRFLWRKNTRLDLISLIVIRAPASSLICAFANYRKNVFMLSLFFTKATYFTAAPRLLLLLLLRQPVEVPPDPPPLHLPPYRPRRRPGCLRPAGQGGGRSGVPQLPRALDSGGGGVIALC